MTDRITYETFDDSAKKALIEKQKHVYDPCNDIENIIGEIDPEVFKCHDCNQWLPLSELSPGHKKPHCVKCHPMPLMGRVFPSTICKDLVTVIPMDAPQVTRGFIKKTFKMYSEKIERKI